MSKRLIYAEDAIDALHDEIVRRRIDEDTNDDGALDEFDTEAIIKDLPSAQPEIIRCRDCKYSHMTYDGDCKYCDIWFPDEPEYMPGDYYCGSAERRRDE